MAKLRVGVLRGGPSTEYEVSLLTGGSVLANLPEHYEPIDILLSRDGVWHLAGTPLAPANLVGKVDLIFNALHGSYGEDGQVQRLLDDLHIPYTGSGQLASALGMNKVHTKEHLRRGGLLVAKEYVAEYQPSAEAVAREVFARLPAPWIVKPADNGSSVGVSLVRTLADLPRALELAWQYSRTALVEEFIRGREATCGVIEGFRGQPIYALLPVEIRKPAESSFFDYEAKYGGISEEICPGNFSAEEREVLEKAACEAHRLLGLRHYSRTDFIVSPKGVYVLETNTLPGLTAQSLLPKSLAAVGVKYADFLDHLIKLALQK